MSTAQNYLMRDFDVKICQGCQARLPPGHAFNYNARNAVMLSGGVIEVDIIKYSSSVCCTINICVFVC
jgi:hypothetical protein